MRILLLDELALTRETLRLFLDAQSDCQVVASCPDPFTAVQHLLDTDVDLIVIGDEPSSESASGFLRQHRREQLPGKVVCLARHVSRLDLTAALEGGAQGIVLKHNPPEVLLAALRQVNSGELYLDPLLDALPPLNANTHASIPALTGREQEVVEGVLSGLSNKEIGERLGVSETATKSSLQQVFRKTGVRTRAQLVRLALEQPLAMKSASTPQ